MQVFHPLVNATTGEVDVRAGFPQWKSGTDQLAHLMLFLKRILYLTEKDFSAKLPSSAKGNADALRLCKADKKGFLLRVAQCVQRSIDEQYKHDGKSTIKFTKPRPEHKKVRISILQHKMSEDKR